jgi:hypothetical protein
MTKKNTSKSEVKAPRGVPNLDSQYGEIGISAVAAAYAPVVPQLDKLADEMADVAA